MSTISAGTTSTTTLIHSGDTTGALVLKTNDTGSGGTTALTISTAQVVTLANALPVASGGTGLTSIAHTVQTFSSGSGTYTTPANVKAILVQIWGGGGSGGGGNGLSARGNGGAGGAFVQKLIASPASTYSYAVGAGGTAAAQGNNGVTGGTTTFSTLSAGGGAGGATASGGAQAGSNGGTASGGDLNINGGNSMILNLASDASTGGNAPQGGQGGQTNVGDAGSFPGGGGANGNFTGSSAAGAAGYILVTEYYV